MARHVFDVLITREQVVRVEVDDEDLDDGEDLEDVAEEYAIEGKGKVIQDDYTIEEVALAVDV